MSKTYRNFSSFEDKKHQREVQKLQKRRAKQERKKARKEDILDNSDEEKNS